MKNKRTIDLIGNDAFVKIQNANVLVIGIGGVGGSAVLSLVRSGVKKITLCDFDLVEETNFNRQDAFCLSYLNKLKTDSMKAKILALTSDVNLKLISRKITPSDLVADYDFVIEAIDNVKEKIIVIKTLIERKIPFISSMGAAGKLDPQLVEITKLHKTREDRLAKVLRKEFKGKIINVVSSTEPQQKSMGSFEPVTKIFGALLATFCLKELMK